MRSMDERRDQAKHPSNANEQVRWESSRADPRLEETIEWQAPVHSIGRYIHPGEAGSDE